jgi:sortase A
MWNVQKWKKAAFGFPKRAGETATRPQEVQIWIERLLFAAGLVLLAIYAAARIESFLGSRNALKKFEATRQPAIPPNLDSGAVEGHPAEVSQPANPAGSFDFPEADFRGWDARRIQVYKETRAEKFDAPLGVLHIGKIHLEVPLLEGTDDLTLNHAVGRIRGTARPGGAGNVGIAGHRDGFFRGLKDIRPGDEIKLETTQGTDTYVVEEIRIVSPKDVSVLRPRNVPTLTLVTCYPFYYIGRAPERYIVTASLATKARSGAEKSETPSAISRTQFKKEKQ